jgi:hypothetical protein
VEAFIDNIEDFLNKCPTSDPIYTTIQTDFEIRRNGVVVGTPSCSEPVTQMMLGQYTDELIALQGLRVIYYMDLGRTGHLPWTAGTLYGWIGSKIGGINISDTTSVSFCCVQFSGKPKPYIVIKAQDDLNRDFDRMWRGISGNIDLYFHEVRHLDNPGHVSCCGIQLGCDSTYDEADLSPYGVQWWLNKAWLTGNLYVGFSCLAPQTIQDIAQWHLVASNSFRDRFCENKPPVLTMPPAPGGLCRPPAAAPQPPTDLRAQ